MAKRKPVALTRRERECRKIARSKAVRKTVQVWVRRAAIGGGATFAVLAIGLGVWEYRDSGISRTVQRIRDGAYAQTAQAGFAVRELSLEGRHRTPLASVQEALALRPGTPILALSLDELRARLEKIPTIKQADVQRQLPHTLVVRITERHPVAVWQAAGKLHLIDDEGAVMDDLALDKFPSLPLVVGEGAASHVEEALALLDASPELAQRVAAFVRVGDRRWNIRMSDGLEIKLPAENARDAWAHFSTVAATRSLLSQPVKSVDLRLPGRIVLRPNSLPGTERHQGADA